MLSPPGMTPLFAESLTLQSFETVQNKNQKNKPPSRTALMHELIEQQKYLIIGLKDSAEYRSMLSLNIFPRAKLPGMGAVGARDQGARAYVEKLIASCGGFIDGCEKRIYDKAKYCINPELIQEYKKDEVIYQLYVSQCNAGWCAGLHYFDEANTYDLEIKCGIPTGVYPDRKTASIEMANTVWHLLTDKQRGPLKELLAKLGATPPPADGHDHIGDTQRYLTQTNTQMAKATAPGGAKKSAKLIAIKEIKNPGLNKAPARGSSMIPDIIAIESAGIKDDLCNYKYLIIEGSQPGFRHSVNGPGIVDESMTVAFRALNVHLAAIDDAFKLSGIAIKKIDKMHTNELALNYHVSSFKVIGESDDISVILIGDKFISAGSRMSLVTPKIILDNLSSYKFTKELKDAIDLCCREVIEYHQGKYTLIETGDDLDDESGKQLAIEIPEADETDPA